MKKILSTFFLVICSLQMSSLHAQLPERDSIYICQYVKDSFTKHGIPGVYVTLADSNGVLIDTMWTERLETPSFLRSSNCLIWLISFVFPAMAVYCMLDSILHTIYMKRVEK